jgi:hypothetical protein
MSILAHWRFAWESQQSFRLHEHFLCLWNPGAAQMTVATLLLLAIMYLSHTCLLWSSTHYCAPLHVSELCPHHATLANEIAALLSTLTVLHVIPKYWPSLASQHVETTEFILTAALHAFFVCAQAVLWSICSCHQARSHFRSPPYEIPSHLSLASNSLLPGLKEDFTQQSQVYCHCHAIKCKKNVISCGMPYVTSQYVQAAKLRILWSKF